MSWREVGALFLVWLTACAGTPPAMRSAQDGEPDEAQVAAARYDLHVFAPDSGAQQPVRIAQADFQRAMRMLAKSAPAARAAGASFPVERSTP